MTHDQSSRYLNLASALTVSFGLILILGLITPLIAVLNFFVDMIHWPLDQSQQIDTDTERALMAILGGVMIGIAAFIWQINEHIYRVDPKKGGRIITIALLAWYIPDGIGSVLTGAWFNVIPNTIFLALFLVPIIKARHAPEGATL